MTRHREIISPFYRFTIAEWARLRDGEPMTLSEEDLDRLRSLNDPMLDQRILGGLGVAYTQLDRPADALLPIGGHA